MRGIVKVVTAVANGDLRQKLVVEAKGEIAALGDTLNNMTETLRIFAEQVTSVAREVGIEGKLGAQAEVPGVAGTWKDLTDNVNLLANNLTPGAQHRRGHDRRRQAATCRRRSPSTPRARCSSSRTPSTRWSIS